ncbi:tRNA 2-selenouridine(34) synthase MnmH [Geobacter sulfurreducens]|uniref:tRNA 2-selenouridine(34) synthase MnmH n=1 Tax=Geobacter sulfurreducens TaxID=35554 RepID=UPI002D105FE3|nr:tRNA 2-selenouridine(34) synthase MnmH [Geobacter sulfurreducens]HML79680.1 tRNA 2-selenouridine(34) synthase MnmH [Geobacter sulfurreducens]
MIKTTPFHESLLDTHLVVDVRTPLEYEEDHLPGAINVPLLTNEERVEIGTIYKQTGPLEARRRGLNLTAHRFPAMVEAIARAAADRPILVYCWRGGLRSKTVVSILDLAGFDAVQLQGGHKAFRHLVLSSFEPFTPPAPLVVLHGMTGVGKTTFLLQLARAGHAVVDLEGLARHRGSAFGELGLRQDISQKRFETLLWDAFRRLPAGCPILLEGESRRIGRLTLPGNLYDVMRGSVKLWCEASVATRVARLTEEYGRPEYRDGMAGALERIRKKLGGDNYEAIKSHLDRWEMEPFMEGLIRHYYDKLYYKTRDWVEDAVISLEDFSSGERELNAFLASRPQAAV